MTTLDELNPGDIVVIAEGNGDHSGKRARVVTIGQYVGIIRLDDRHETVRTYRAEDLTKSPVDGDVIEVFLDGHGPRLGIVANLPKVRRVVRLTTVDSRRGDAVGFDHDGARVILTATQVAGAKVLIANVDVKAGWANELGLIRGLDGTQAAR